MIPDVNRATVVEYSVKDHIAQVTLNRPDVLNAVSTPLLIRLREVFDEIEDDPSVRCVVFKGAGRAFCVGADQKERLGMQQNDVRRRRRIAPATFSAMRACSHPVIAQVHGYALGSGLEFAIACDMAIAAEGTVMGLIETRLGAIPGGGATQLLPRLIGLPRAKELILTGRKFTAEQALEWGMLNYVVPAEHLEAKIADLAREVAESAPIANTQAKRAINMSIDLDLKNGFEAEAALYERTISTRDRAEALDAYKERRTPEFIGE
jgi:enoyl-CoA hydratase/carnithine racemase